MVKASSQPPAAAAEGKQEGKHHYRDFETVNEAVREHYRQMRIGQTVSFVQMMNKRFGRHSTTTMDVWEAIDRLSEFVDVSDPDVALPNAVHLYQTAEGMRAAGEPEWMQVVGLLHDLGKILFVRGEDEIGCGLKQQWAVAGDTFVVGAPLPDTLVYPEFNAHNPDASNPKYNSGTGMYEAGCGLDNCLVAFGHDEYMFQVLSRTPGVNIPPQGLDMIRYHSLYPWHACGAYADLENDKDRKTKEWVLRFNKYDLYTKENTTYTPAEEAELRVYYTALVSKFVPGPLLL